MITLEQLEQWILSNRRDNAFKYNLDKLLLELTTCLDSNSILCVTENSQLVGVACWHEDCLRKLIHVYDILTTEKGVIKKMFHYFNTRYPGYSIEGKHKTGRTLLLTKTQTIENRLPSYGK